MSAYCYDQKEAVKRMTRRGKKFVRWTLKTVTVDWRYIPATETRNWDSSSAGIGNDSNKEILQQTTWKLGELPRFSNYW